MHDSLILDATWARCHLLFSLSLFFISPSTFANLFPVAKLRSVSRLVLAPVCVVCVPEVCDGVERVVDEVSVRGEPGQRHRSQNGGSHHHLF